jgi:hypothetical protein
MAINQRILRALTIKLIFSFTPYIHQLGETWGFRHYHKLKSTKVKRAPEPLVPST